MLDERIFSEKKAKLQAVFGLDVKDVQLLIGVTVFVFEQVSVSQSHWYSSQDVAVVGGTGGWLPFCYVNCSDTSKKD